ncbi:MAG: hypothetical protein IK066_06905 [Kiritimatiellae bacterium]|nr:hypothetical protein [Kiritimatiellia bacterium]
MKTVRTCVAAGEGTGEARRAVEDTLVMLTRHFWPKLEFVDAGAADGNWAIVLYGKDFGKLGRSAFENLYRRKTEGKNPEKISVFFKEPDSGTTEAMKAFKESFAEKFGDFHCAFETVDTVKFQVAAQSLPLLPGGGEGLLKVSDSRIQLEGETVADLEKLPFARLNAKRQSLLRQLRNIEREIEELKEELSDAPEDRTLADSLTEALARRREIRGQLQMHELFLCNTALFFAKESGGLMDARTRKARALFEQGKVQAANEMLDFGALVAKDERDAVLYREALAMRQKAMLAFLDTGDMLHSMGMQGNSSLLLRAREAYRAALAAGKEIFCDQAVLDGIQAKIDALSNAGQN